MYSLIVVSWMIDEDRKGPVLSGEDLIVYAYFFQASGTNGFRVRTHDIGVHFPRIRRWLKAFTKSESFDIEMIIDKLMAIGCFEETPDGFRVVDLETIED